jgi:hypothetical protein
LLIDKRGAIAVMQTQELPTEQRLVCSGTNWQQFKSIQAGFSESPGIRLHYYKGTLEIVATSPEHEIFKSIIAYLITIFLLGKGLSFFLQDR